MENQSMQQLHEMVINAYDTISHAYADAYSENDETDFKYFNCFLSNLPNKKILDMGCGVGTNTSFLAKHNCDVIGVDASAGMLREARKTYPDLVFDNHNILHTPYADSSFGGIVLAYVIEHFNMEGLLLLRDEISRLLVDNGLLFIALHEGNSEEILPDPLDDNVSIYYNFISLDTVKKLFVGYNIIDCQSRASYGPEEFLNDKYFITLQKLPSPSTKQ